VEGHVCGQGTSHLTHPSLAFFFCFSLGGMYIYSTRSARCRRPNTPTVSSHLCARSCVVEKVARGSRPNNPARHSFRPATVLPPSSAPSPHLFRSHSLAPPRIDPIQSQALRILLLYLSFTRTKISFSLHNTPPPSSPLPPPSFLYC